jgi:hypothetical protein
MNRVGQHDTGRKTADKHSGHGFEFSGTKYVCKRCSVVIFNLDGVVFSDGLQTDVIRFLVRATDIPPKKRRPALGPN